MTSHAEASIHLETNYYVRELGAGLLMFTTVAIGILSQVLRDRIQPGR